jgi:hypothetical protein
MTELSIAELLVILITPFVIVAGVYFLFWVGALGPDPEPEPPNNP